MERRRWEEGRMKKEENTAGGGKKEESKVLCPQKRANEVTSSAEQGREGGGRRRRMRVESAPPRVPYASRVVWNVTGESRQDYTCPAQEAIRRKKPAWEKSPKKSAKEARTTVVYGGHSGGLN